MYTHTQTHTHTHTHTHIYIYILIYFLHSVVYILTHIVSLFNTTRLVCFVVFVIGCMSSFRGAQWLCGSTLYFIVPPQYNDNKGYSDSDSQNILLYVTECKM